MFRKKESTSQVQKTDFDSLTARIAAMFKNGKVVSACFSEFHVVASVWVPLALARFNRLAETWVVLQKSLDDAVEQATLRDNAFAAMRDINVELCGVLDSHGINLTPEQLAKIQGAMDGMSAPLNTPTSLQKAQTA